MDDLNKLREQIDALDTEIYERIKQRAQVAHEVGKYKQSIGDTHFYRPEREAQILRKVIETNDSLLKDSDMAYIFRQIISSCLALEQPMTIGYLGPIGTWSEEAVYKHFGNAVNGSPLGSIEEVFLELSKGNISYGVVPIENSNNGTVTTTIKQLYSYNAHICGEVEICIQHQLLANSRSSNITTIAAHSQALGQCREFLRAKYPNIALKEVSSNAKAAELATHDNSIAAIASKNAAEIYQLEILHSNIQDDENNTTRFLVIGNEVVPASGKDKTTVLITTAHKSGTLYDILTPFKTHGINLLKLDSYPDPNANKWQYLFYLDFAGHKTDTTSKAVLETIAEHAVGMKVLGSYPMAVL